MRAMLSGLYIGVDHQEGVYPMKEKNGLTLMSGMFGM